MQEQSREQGGPNIAHIMHDDCRYHAPTPQQENERQPTHRQRCNQVPGDEILPIRDEGNDEVLDAPKQHHNSGSSYDSLQDFWHMPGRKRDMSLLLKEGEPRVEVSTRQMDMHEDGVAPLQKFSIPDLFSEPNTF